jgi:hypothetical protein
MGMAPGFALANSSHLNTAGYQFFAAGSEPLKVLHGSRGRSDEPVDCWVVTALPPAAMALEEQRSEKYRHALIVMISIGVRAGQLGGTDAWLSFNLVSHA